MQHNETIKNNNKNDIAVNISEYRLKNGVSNALICPVQPVRKLKSCTGRK